MAKSGLSLADIVAQSLTGDGVITGHDAKGPYVIWDEIHVDTVRRVVEFKNRGHVIGSISADFGTLTNTTLTIAGLEGRSRIEVREA